MAPSPILVLGVVASIMAALFVYSRQRNIKRSIMAFILGVLTFATPFHFLLVGYYLGSWANRQIYRRWSHNWGSFLVSLLGILPLVGIWQASLKLILGLAVYGVDDVAGGIIVGIGVAYILVILMLFGIVVFVLSSLYVSFKRRNTPVQAVDSY